MDVHEVAELFPLMSTQEYTALKHDIAEHGQREAIWLHPDGRIIDGRNRYRACMELGIEPSCRTHTGNHLIEFVLSLNLHRRHLNESQRGMVANKLAKMERGRQTNSSIELFVSQGQAAALLSVGVATVKRCKALTESAPDLASQVEAGSMTVTAAAREVKERKREARREENQAKVESAPTMKAAKFATIVIDPPWDWGDEGDINQMGRAKPDYATLSFDQLRALPVGDFADVDCHLYLWITNRSLPKGFDLLERWGFRYITCLTWVKPSFGLGNYFRGQTEQVLFAVRGSQPLKRKDVSTVFHAQRGAGGHSSKPDAFYPLVESCSPGPYLEMFARNQRVGWVAWGEDGASDQL